MKRKLDLMTVLGLALAIILIVGSIMLTQDPVDAENPDKKTYSIIAGNLKAFYDLPSVAIVIGGTVATLMIMFPMSQFAKIPKHLKILVMPRQYRPEEYIDKLVEEAKKARINGLLSLEADIEEMSDAFLKKSLQMLVDGVDAEVVKTQLESALDNLDERHSQERGIYDKGAALGPAFGMVGTLIGLINMLKNLQDVASVGPNMAVALITTFYGTLLANVIFAPISNKLRVRHEEEYLCMRIICEGAQAIQAGTNPKLLQEKLVNILPEYQRKKLAAKLGSGESESEAGGKKEKAAKKTVKKAS